MDLATEVIEKNVSDVVWFQHYLKNEPSEASGLFFCLVTCAFVAVVYPVELWAPFSDSWPLSLADVCRKMRRVLVSRHTIMIWQESSETTREETKLSFQRCRSRVFLFYLIKPRLLHLLTLGSVDSLADVSPPVSIHGSLLFMSVSSIP